MFFNVLLYSISYNLLGSPDEAKDLSISHQPQMSSVIPGTNSGTSELLPSSAFSSSNGLPWTAFTNYAPTNCSQLTPTQQHCAISNAMDIQQDTSSEIIDQVNFGASTSSGHPGQSVLAKPVPMRRLSEKRIAQARACIGAVPGGVPDHSDRKLHLNIVLENTCHVCKH